MTSGGHPLHNARVYVLSEDVFGARLGPETLPRLLAYIDIRNGLASLAKLLWVLEDSGPILPSVQLQIASRILPPIPFSRAQALLRAQPHTIFFFRPQIHITMKHLCLHGQYNDPPKPVLQSQIQTLGAALFASTDLIATESVRLRKSLAGADRVKRIAFQLALGEHLMKSPDILHDFVRIKSMYQTIHGSEEARSHPDFVDLDEVFQDATNVTLTEYMEVGLGFIMDLLRYRGAPELLSAEQEFILFHPRTWFSTSRVPNETVAAVIKSVAQAPGEIANVTTVQTSRERAHDFRDMKLRPLISLGDDTVLPVSFDFVAEKLSTGIYWTVFDALRDKGPGDPHLKFSRYHGHLFERYVGEVATAIVEQHRGTYEPPIIDAIYHVGKQQKKTCDVLLTASDHIFALEATASRLTAKRTVALGIPEAFLADCNKVIIDKAIELATFLRDLLEEKVTVEGRVLTPGSRRVFPVLVSLEGFPRILPIDAYIYGELDRQAVFAGMAVRPLSILSIADLEFVARFPPKSLGGLFDSWQADARFPYVPLPEFASEVPERKAEQSSPWFEAGFTRVLDEAARTILGQSLDSILVENRAKSKG